MLFGPKEPAPAHRAANPPPAVALDRLTTSKGVALGALVAVLIVVTGVTAFLLPDDDGGAETAADDLGRPGTDATSATTTRRWPTSTTQTTGATTTTTALLGVVDPQTTTTTTQRPTTTRPPSTTTTTQATTTTARPAPVIDSFNASVADFGCGRGSSLAWISWSTTNATSVSLGPVPGPQSPVSADAQASEHCVDDDGETWRLTASSPAGTVTRDISINP